LKRYADAMGVLRVAQLQDPALLALEKEIRVSRLRAARTNDLAVDFGGRLQATPMMADMQGTTYAKSILQVSTCFPWLSSFSLFADLIHFCQYGASHAAKHHVASTILQLFAPMTHQSDCGCWRES
jgi:hypothetical protein